MIAGLNMRLCCRDTDSTERYHPHARHPGTACTHYHAVHAHHGVAVSQTITVHLKGSIIKKPMLIFFPPQFFVALMKRGRATLAPSVAWAGTVEHRRASYLSMTSNLPLTSNLILKTSLR